MKTPTTSTSDRMTEELITAMSGLQGLQVIARTPVMNIKGEKTKTSSKEQRIYQSTEVPSKLLGNLYLFPCDRKGPHLLGRTKSD